MHRCEICGYFTAAAVCPVCASADPGRTPQRAVRFPTPPPGFTRGPIPRRPPTSVAGGSFNPPRPPTVPPMAAGGPQQPSPTDRFEFDARVTTTPEVLQSRSSIDGFVSVAAWVLLVLVVVTTQAFWGPFLLLVFVVGFLVWGMSKLRLGVLLSFGLLAAGRRRPRQPRERDPLLVFHVSDGTSTRDVRLHGHDTGLQLGNRVSVLALPRNGIVHPLRVRNLDTGVTMWRGGLARLVALSAVNVYFVAILAERWLSR